MSATLVAPPISESERVVPRFAWLPVFTAMGALLLLLGATSNAYGYHRDELYFRILPPAWGYTDQPPLTPLIAHATAIFGDQPWSLHVPAILFAVASVGVVALIAREVGGGGLAQGLAAWGYAFGAVTLIMGHSLFTASLDLIVWPAVMLFVIRVFTRAQPWWWMIAGLVVGLSMYNKLLIAMLLIGVAVGLLAVGPRTALASWWPYAGIGVALVIGAPNLVYQVVNGWPQLQMGAALAAEKSGDVRPLLVPFLLIELGPFLVPIWVAGIVALFRRRAWRSLRWIPIAFVVVVALVFLAGSQVYYGYGLLATVYAIGCVPTAEWARRRRWRLALVIVGVVVSSAGGILLSLPILPVRVEANTPIGAIDQAIRDQVGWPQYVEEVDDVVHQVASGGDTVIIATNYGEAGALDRYLPAGSPGVYSGHNALGTLPPPPRSTKTVVFVGAEYPRAELFFQHCVVSGHLDDEVGMDNEEQGQPIAVCTGPTVSMSDLMAKLRHLG
ncbi:glycosyltransferase family 39 protein [Humibacter ginsenosidimutans]|uniref:Glycosyltransferase family 39 protein n=1 Tax=Humibacter ginsenosidimutans TaxID=2599293 RepID=A0A5B8M756_9MICO|nr:glycosyltransferase family 39 protein [Humibacter ginsenosidimutans]QDZ16021.1 glycosyltransferase family 39 protein [Humibacter ginsenosidimutans]